MSRVAILDFLFGFKGRIGRAGFWLGLLIQALFLCSGTVIAFEIIDNLKVAVQRADEMREISIAALISITAISLLATSVKRAHDREKSAIYVIILSVLSVIPLFGIWLLTELGCARGSIGPNRYGADPLANRRIREYSKAIQLNPNDALAFIGRGAAFGFKGEYDHAIRDLEQAIRLDPRDPEAFNNRAFVHFRSGKFESAIADYDMALSLNPKSAEALFGRGTARLKIADAAGNADIAAAYAVNAHVAEDMARLGIG